VVADRSGIHRSRFRYWLAQPGHTPGDHEPARSFRPGRGHRRRTGAETVGAPLSLDGSPPGKAPAPVLPPRMRAEPS